MLIAKRIDSIQRLNLSTSEGFGVLQSSPFPLARPRIQILRPGPVILHEDDSRAHYA